jgi:hypothetical protein
MNWVFGLGLESLDFGLGTFGFVSLSQTLRRTPET